MSGRRRKTHTDHYPFPPLSLCREIEGSRLHHWLPKPCWVPNASIGRGSWPLSCALCIFVCHYSTKACRAHHSIAVFITNTCYQPLRPSEAKPHARRGKSLRRDRVLFPANGAFICPCVPVGYSTIKFFAEALRMEPRRSEEV